MTVFLGSQIDEAQFTRYLPDEISPIWTKDKDMGKGKGKGYGSGATSSGGTFQGVSRLNPYPFKAYTQRVADDNWARIYHDFQAELNDEPDDVMAA